jgi:hypothetical protein
VASGCSGTGFKRPCLSLAATLVAACRLNARACAHKLPLATGRSSGDLYPADWFHGDPWARQRGEEARASLRLVPIPGLTDATRLIMSTAVGCVIRRDGSVACFDGGGQDGVHSLPGAPADPRLRRLSPEAVHGVGP